METSREKATGTIRLRYNRQFQNGGHTHTIDAECLLPVGASQEAREQVAREIELSVAQLVQQIARQSTRSTEGARSQHATPAPPAQVATRPPMPPVREPEATTALPAARLPVSESMPTTPVTGGERKIRLPDFINVIKKHWDMSPQEAMKLLRVQTLDGLNYREAYTTLKGIVERRNASTQSAATPYNSTRPVPMPPEAPRPTNRNVPPGSGLPSSVQTPRPQSQAVSQTTPGATAIPPVEPTSPEHTEPALLTDMAGPHKAPLPPQLGTVRDLAPRTYFTEEEDYEGEEDGLPDEQAAKHLSGKLKLDELKELRGNTMASAGRIKVLDNVMGSQVNEAELQKIMQAAWGVTTAKKLKADQIESLITWAKEDSFEEEVAAVLAWLANEEAQ